MTELSFAQKIFCVLASAIALFCLSAGAQAAKFEILYTFQGQSDGRAPSGGKLLMDSAGNLYGATRLGGGAAKGVVFKLAPDGTETILHSFRLPYYSPYQSLVADESGNLYGSTGSNVVYKLAPDGTFSVLRAFRKAPSPSPVIIGNDGNLYGETFHGGDQTCINGCGTVFQLTPHGHYSLVHVFRGRDGAYPSGGLSVDPAGNLYGTATDTHTIDNRWKWGNVFRVTPDGAMNVLYTFTHPRQGTEPIGVSMDATGNLYGAALEGGHLSSDCSSFGCGKIFRLAPDGELTALHAFHGGHDGGNPNSMPVLDEQGNLYGTYVTDYKSGIYRISPDGKFTTLYSITANALLWKNGALYGTAPYAGDTGYGVVFRLTP